jgi:hypothetical protein
MFIGFKDYGVSSPEDATMSYTVGKFMTIWFVTLLFESHECHLKCPLDTNIHHVEHWGPLVNNYLAAQVDSYSRDAFTKEIEAKIAQGIDFEELRKSEYYNDILTYGKNCQKNYVDFKWVSVLHVPIL